MPGSMLAWYIYLTFGFDFNSKWRYVKYTKDGSYGDMIAVTCIKEVLCLGWSSLQVCPVVYIGCSFWEEEWNLSCVLELCRTVLILSLCYDSWHVGFKSHVQQSLEVEPTILLGSFLDEDKPLCWKMVKLLDQPLKKSQETWTTSKANLAM